jgi:CheY-like chemotaxis protein
VLGAVRALSSWCACRSSLTRRSDPTSRRSRADAAGKRTAHLIVDDHRDSADSLALLLKRDGHEIQTAYDGLEAFEAAATFRPEVVVMDIGLPKLNGYDPARKIRTQRRGENIVSVALTGWGSEEDRDRTKAVGFNPHLVKPLNHAALTELLAE